MTPESMRIALAEYHGWVFHEHYLIGPLGGQASRGFAMDTRRVGPLCVPDYLGSLDIVHGVERGCFDGKHALWSRYLGEELPTVCARDDAGPPECATAPQRCEAILKTLNLWKAA